MKQQSKTNYLLVIIMAIILTSIIIIATLAQSAFNVAYAAQSDESLEEKAERYTDSDTLANGIGKIQYYPESYHLSKTLIESSPKYAYAQYSIEVTESDPIVNIVPMEYFINRGTYLYIGKEYGFFVKTIGQDFSQFETGGYESKNNIVDVMVFDIEDEYDFDQTTDRILVTMRNLFI